MKEVIRQRDILSHLPFKNWLRYPICASLTSHGCNRNCATCGGSREAYRQHFGRNQVAWRDPELLARDIGHIQRHVWGPVFVLNDFLQAGPSYARRFIRGLAGKLKNPIGFEFFGPPREGRELYDLLAANLPNWSVEISAESHDDDIRTAFGKGHYRSEELEQTIKDALGAGCDHFDLYFMTGIPTQTRESVLQTGEYVRHLYECVGNDPRLSVFIAPMAPFLDVGSCAFDRPDEYGYRLRARSLAEHRQRMVLPSWKHIMNYESTSLSTDDLVSATYQAALDINQIKGQVGVVVPDVAERTAQRIREARAQMNRLDEVLAAHPGSLQAANPEREAALHALKSEFERLSQSTVMEKTELTWSYRPRLSHVVNNIALGAHEFVRNTAAALRGEWASSASEFSYPSSLSDHPSC
jgi:B12-binding domain/radical SAM domain protein